MVTFQGNFETDKHFKVIPITVVECEKDHGLLGIVVLKVDTTRLINSKEVQENEIGLLIGYKYLTKKKLSPKIYRIKKSSSSYPAFGSGQVKQNDTTRHTRKSNSRW